MDLVDRCKVLVHDLLNYESEEARERLSLDPEAPLFLSRAYFSPEEMEELRSTRLSDGKTLAEALECVLERKKGNGDYELCTSHDIAPVLQQALGIRKDFHKTPAFKKALKAFNKDWRKKKASKDER